MSQFQFSFSLMLRVISSGYLGEISAKPVFRFGEILRFGGSPEHTRA
jgi:hypothetical protein